MTDIDNKTYIIQESDTTQKASVEEPISQNSSPSEENFSNPRKKYSLFCMMNHILHYKKKFFYKSLGAIILIFSAIIGLNIATNNYITPIKVLEKYENAEEFTLQKYSVDHEGGLAKNKSNKFSKLSETPTTSYIWKKKYTTYLFLITKTDSMNMVIIF